MVAALTASAKNKKKKKMKLKKIRKILSDIVGQSRYKDSDEREALCEAVEVLDELEMREGIKEANNYIH